jgi:hypothetical protein
MSDNVKELAKRAANDPFFLAFSVREKSDDQLRALLQCDDDTLIRLRLCRAPKDLADCRVIGERLGLSTLMIAHLCGVK